MISLATLLAVLCAVLLFGAIHDGRILALDLIEPGTVRKRERPREIAKVAACMVVALLALAGLAVLVQRLAVVQSWAPRSFFC